MTKHICPNCDSDNLIVREVTSFFLNTGQYFCQSVVQHDLNAQVACLDCHWEGERKYFKEEQCD